MHSQTLFSMLDSHLHPKSPIPGAASYRFADRSIEFSLDAEPAISFLEAQVFEQLVAGCSGRGELSTIVLAADPAILWRHVQGGLGKILHCGAAGGLKVRLDREPQCPFMELRRLALYKMANHLTEIG